MDKSGLFRIWSSTVAEVGGSVLGFLKTTYEELTENSDIRDSLQR